MITFLEAKEIVQNYIGQEMAIMEEGIIEKPYGWYFSYQSKEYVDTRNELYLVLGIAGLMFRKENGKICLFGTDRSFEENVQAYEKGLLEEIDPKMTKREENTNSNSEEEEWQKAFSDNGEEGLNKKTPSKSKNNNSKSIHFAMLNESVKSIINRMNKEIDFNERDDKGKTPLSLAACSGRLLVCGLLIKKGADVNIEDNEGSTPLHNASEARDRFVSDEVDDNGEFFKVVALLIQKGAKINSLNSKGLTPLHQAAFTGDYKIIELLLTNGADPNIKNKNGETPLDLLDLEYIDEYENGDKMVKILKKYMGKE